MGSPCLFPAIRHSAWLQHVVSDPITERAVHLAPACTKHLAPSESEKLEEPTMIQPKRLAKLARKLRRAKTTTRDDDTCVSTSRVADKGHCTLYTVDGRRFEVPLEYLSTTIFSELLRMSQEEFGFTKDGRITLHCDATMVEYVMCLLRGNVSEEVEKAFLRSVVTSCEHSSHVTPYVAQQFAVCSS